MRSTQNFFVGLSALVLFVFNVVLSQKEGARFPTSPSNPRTGVAHNLSTLGWRYQKRGSPKTNLSTFVYLSKNATPRNPPSPCCV
jgi:hypothetical protein